MKKLLKTLLIAGMPLFCIAQNVGIGTTTPNASAQLDISSTSKGMLMPRLTTAQRLGVVYPATGLLVFDTDKRTIYMYDGAQWLAMLFAANTLTGQTAANSAADDYLGSKVAISGDYAIIGAPGKTVGANQYQGSAYIFKRAGNNWQQMQELGQGDGAAADLFGNSVSINGSTAVVGAYNKTVGTNASQGAVYVYSLINNSWQFQKKLTAIGGQANDQFGKSVSNDGDTILAGAPNRTVNSISNVGGAYVFTKNNATWNESDLTPSDGTTGDQFGTSVSIYAGLIAIGSPGKSSFYPYFYSGGSWAPIPPQSPAGISINDRFGASIAVGENFVAAGAPNQTINGNANQGAVYIFIPTNPVVWQYSAFTANDGNADEYFGSSIASQNGKIIVGAPNKNINLNQNQGAAYLLTPNNTNWLQQKIISGDGAAGDYFGNGVGVSSNFVVAGAPGKSNNTGNVYFINTSNL